MGRPIIMGRKTWESIGSKPLPGRQHIVLSHSPHPMSYVEDMQIWARTPDYALEIAYLKHEEPFVIGGGEIYEMFAPLATRLVFTRVLRHYDGDTFFPVIALNDWTQTLGDDNRTAEVPHEFVEWTR